MSGAGGTSPASGAGGRSASFGGGGATAAGGNAVGGAAGREQTGGRGDGTSGGGAGGSGAVSGMGGRPSTAGASGLGAAAGSGRGGSGGSPAADGNIYVSPTGDDANPGTLAEPVKTLSKARDLVQSRTATMTADITVLLRDGTYPVSNTLTLANADSGKNGFYVKYVAYPGERPLITGGKPLTGWQPANGMAGVYSAPVGTARFRQLYVNGVKAIRARTPNLDAGGAANFVRLSGWDKTAHNVQLSSSAVSNWNHLTQVEMHLMIAWADATLRIASITSSGGTASVEFQSAEDALLFVRPNPRLDQVGWGSGRALYFENALEMLDQPGEWYLDETANVLYYKPRAGEDMTTATVIAPMLETLMSIKGTSTSDQASYLWFEGLTFAHSTFLRPSQYGYLDAQAGQYNLTADANNNQTVARPPAAVSVTNANHVHFEKNLFTELGATGLDFVSGTHDDLLIGNAFTDIAGNGVSVGKFSASDLTEFHVAYNPSDKNEICSHETIKDNFIDNVTTEFQGACGIAAGYPAYIDIEHNEVAHTNYTGISVGFGWTASPTAMTNNKINYNDIHHVVQVLADGAAIYVLSNQGTGSEMQYNYVHDYSTSKWADYGSNGLYLDEQTSGYTVAHNVMVNCPTNVAQNHTGTNSITDNGASPSGAQNTIATAGIEASYADIKKLTIVPAKF